jgi:methionyl aminopeptidase
MKRGAQWAHGMLSSSRNKVSYGGESSFPFQAGDIVRNDYVSYYNGYPGHQNRTAVLGQPTTTQSETYQLVRDIYRATIDRCQSNTRAIDVYRFAVASFRSAGFKDRLNVVGHGIGPWWHQQEPYIVAHTDAILETGMVLALEPGVSYWRLQDLILITNNGPELLSAKFNTDEMFVIESSQ